MGFIVLFLYNIYVLNELYEEKKATYTTIYSIHALYERIEALLSSEWIKAK